MRQKSLADHYCTIAEAAQNLDCTEEKVVRLLEQGDVLALINAEYESILGFMTCGYLQAGPEVVRYITSQRCETVQFVALTGSNAEAKASLENVRVHMPSLHGYQSNYAGTRPGEEPKRIISSAAEEPIIPFTNKLPCALANTVPGKIPRNANTKETVNLAWELEIELGRRPTPGQVMDRICERAKSGDTIFQDPAKDRKSVRWWTSKSKLKPYYFECVMKTLERWYGSRTDTHTAHSTFTRPVPFT